LPPSHATGNASQVDDFRLNDIRRGVHQEVVEPERLIFTSAALDEEGNALFEVLNTVTFAEQSGKVKQISLARVINRTAKAAPYLPGMEEGWSQSLDRLGELLAKP
jgi:uncharacterized protein YndB with AHSA1/START domain